MLSRCVCIAQREYCLFLLLQYIMFSLGPSTGLLYSYNVTFTTHATFPYPAYITAVTIHNQSVHAIYGCIANGFDQAHISCFARYNSSILFNIAVTNANFTKYSKPLRTPLSARNPGFVGLVPQHPSWVHHDPILGAPALRPPAPRPDYSVHQRTPL